MSSSTIPAADTDQHPITIGLRTTGTGVALIGGPLLLVAGNLLGTPGDSDSAPYLTQLATSAGAEQVSVLCFLLGFTLFVPGVFGLLPFITRRGATLATIGAWLAAVGVMAYAGLTTTGIANIGLAQSLPVPQAAHVVDQLQSLTAAGVVFALGLGLPVGVVVMAIALRRAGRTPLWVPIVTAVGFLVVMAVESTLGGIVGDLLLLASLGYVGLRLLTRRDQA